MIPTLIGAVASSDIQQSVFYISADYTVDIPSWANYVDIISIGSGDAGGFGSFNSGGGAGGKGGNCLFQTNIPTIGHSQIKCVIALGGDAASKNENAYGYPNSITWDSGISECMINPSVNEGGNGGPSSHFEPFYGSGGGAPGSELGPGNSGAISANWTVGAGGTVNAPSIIASHLGAGSPGLSVSTIANILGNSWGGGGGGGSGASDNGYGTDGGNGGVYLLFKSAPSGGGPLPPG